MKFPLQIGVRRIALLAAALLSPGWLASAQTAPVEPGLTAHEWGTFTSIAGREGRAVEWQPLTGSTDLPSFVEHFRNPGTKASLSGTVRMETPVLYFYSNRDLTLSVHVAFSRGLITEWYPHASRVTPAADVRDTSLSDKTADGSISWDSIHLSPSLAPDFPRDAPNGNKANDNRYYAARATAATPLILPAPAGAQHEKFLFYRGVSSFSVPLSATFTADGGVLVKNLVKEEVPDVILFERRGEKMGYRISTGLQNQAVIKPPELTSAPEVLFGDLLRMLVARGLYSDEAHAMLETWKYSWFEEGSRLIYLVPSGFVDTVLPLTIKPAPAQTVRVFVGRLELISPATEKAVAAALASHDNATLLKYGRFLEPILRTIKEKRISSARPLQQPSESLR